MKRLLYDELLRWRRTTDRKPLLLQGARQTGKTYLLKEFGETEYEKLAYFNLEEAPELSSVFESSLQGERLIQALSAVAGKGITPNDTLIFLDEIQECPRAITSLKYFCEELPEYHVAAAGSLLGVSVGKTSSFPVGKVNFMSLYPMTFCEYLQAAGEDNLLEQITDSKPDEPLPQIVHEMLQESLKYYLFVGGMPEVVETYLHDKTDVERVRERQREILIAYQNDFSKHTSASEAIRISEIWRSLPTQLAREKRKFKYSDARKGGRAARFESAIEWLRRSGLVHVVYNLKCPKLPLAGYADMSKFKLYALDTGLLGAMLGLPSATIVQGHALFMEYKGALVENYVACELACKGIDDLFYWTSGSQAEVDFVLAYRGKIMPLEVKSGMSRGMKSLRVYADRYEPEHIYRTSPRNFTMADNFINIPLFAVMRFPDMV